MKHRLRALAASAAVAAMFTACSTSAPKDDSTGANGDKIATGEGVTDHSIQLGYMTDLSGPIAAHAKVNLAATRMYLKKLNAAGGICGRTVKLTITDMGYDVSKAVAQYPSVTPEVLGYLTILGSPILEALQSRIQKDNMTVGAADWDSHRLSNPNLMVFGATYDLEEVNGLSYFLQKGLVKKGDTVGQIYWPGYGEDAVVGTKWAAKKLGLKVKAIEVDPAKSDLTSEVGQLKNAGVSAILVSTLQQQTTAIATETAALGWNVPLLGNDPTFLPQILDTPAKQALIKRLYVASQRVPLSAPAAAAVLKAFQAAKPAGVPASDGVVVGWVIAKAYTDVLKTACADGKLTRDGMVAALRKSSAVDTGGLMPTLDYSKEGVPPTRSVFITRPDPSQVGGLRLLTPKPYTSDLAKQYTPDV